VLSASLPYRPAVAAVGNCRQLGVCRARTRAVGAVLATHACGCPHHSWQCRSVRHVHTGPASLRSSATGALRVHVASLSLRLQTLELELSLIRGVFQHTAEDRASMIQANVATYLLGGSVVACRDPVSPVPTFHATSPLLQPSRSSRRQWDVQRERPRRTTRGWQRSSSGKRRRCEAASWYGDGCECVCELRCITALPVTSRARAHL
jgi:hypothetical protein